LVHANGCFVTSHKKNLFAKVGLPSNSSHRRFQPLGLKEAHMAVGYFKEWCVAIGRPDGSGQALTDS